MTNNIFIGPDAECRFALTSLRQLEAKGTISNGKDLLPNVFFNFDAKPEFKASYVSTVDNLIKIKTKVGPGGEKPEWFTLHIKMGNLALDVEAVVGIVCKSKAASSLATKICLRSGHSNGFIDTFLPKTVASFAESSTHLDVVEVAKLRGVPLDQTWRELILFFETDDIDIEISDMRIFIV